MIAKELRKSQKRKNAPCYICGKHRAISQWHHVYPLKMCADLFNANQLDSITSPMIPLCPNCHAYVHKWMKRNKFNNMLDVLREVRTYDSLTEQEFDSIGQLVNKAEKFKYEVLTD